MSIVRRDKLFSGCYQAPHKQGFTLIELLVVLAIVSILVTLTVPAFQGSVAKIQRTEGQTLLLEVQTHLERYQFSNHRYPQVLSELSAYQTDQIPSEHGYYEVSLDMPGSSCPAVSCYRLIAEHRSKKVADRLVVHSSGQREGPW